MTNTPTSYHNGTTQRSHQDSSQPHITIRIESGPLSPAQIQAGKRFWRRLTASVREELQAEDEGKDDC